MSVAGGFFVLLYTSSSPRVLFFVVAHTRNHLFSICSADCI